MKSASGNPNDGGPGASLDERPWTLSFFFDYLEYWRPVVQIHKHQQQGQAIVELALAMTFLLWFAMGSLDFGRVFYTSLGLTNAAREGARRAALLAPVCDTAAVQGAVRAEQTGLFAPSDTKTLITLTNCDKADRRTVTITNYPFQPITPFIAKALGNGTVIPLSASATMPVVNQ
jgi:hypothetical protein